MRSKQSNPLLAMADEVALGRTPLETALSGVTSRRLLGTLPLEQTLAGLSVLPGTPAGHPRDVLVALAVELLVAHEDYPPGERARLLVELLRHQAIHGPAALKRRHRALVTVLSCTNRDYQPRQWADAAAALGSCLSDSGEPQEALGHLRDAVRLYRVLAEREPETVRSQLGGALNNLGNALADLGDASGAREAYEEALGLLRAVAAAQVEALRPEVATTLNNLGTALARLGDWTGARAAFEEALGLRRELAERKPEAFRAGVAATLNNLANVLRRLEDNTGARTVCEEALALYRELDAQEPETFRTRLATALNNLGNVLGDLGDNAAARAAYEESLAIRRPLSVRETGSWPGLVGTLNNLGAVLSRLGDDEGARGAFVEALGLCRELAGRSAEAFAPEMAMTLNNLGTVQRSRGDRAAAEVAYLEALGLYRDLAEREPTRHGLDLVGTLSNCADLLSAEAGAAADIDPTAPAQGKARELYREAAQTAARELYREAAGMAERVATEAEERQFLPLATEALHRLVGLYSELALEAERRRALDQLYRLNPERARRAETIPLRPGWYPLLRGIFDRKREAEAQLRETLNAPPEAPELPEGALGQLLVLRRWASYTAVPLLRADAASAIGGGYLLRWGNFGVVVDPGLGFSESFARLNLVPQAINAVIGTHHHVDHTGDMLSLVTSIFEMNEEYPANPVDFLLSPSVFGVFSDVLAFLPGVRSLVLLRPEDPEPVELALPAGGSLRVQPVRAQHRDLTGRSDVSIGLVLSFRDAEGHESRVGISSDTRHYPGLGNAFADVDLMVVHLGSLYPADLGEGERRGWHLGFSGMVQLLGEMKAASRPGWNPLIVVSEWGEEMKAERTEVCEALAEVTGLARVWPAELNASFGLGDRRARPICSEWPTEYATDWLSGREPEGRIEYILASPRYGPAHSPLDGDWR